MHQRKSLVCDELRRVRSTLTRLTWLSFGQGALSALPDETRTKIWASLANDVTASASRQSGANAGWLSADLLARIQALATSGLGKPSRAAERFLTKWRHFFPTARRTRTRASGAHGHWALSRATDVRKKTTEEPLSADKAGTGTAWHVPRRASAT